MRTTARLLWAVQRFVVAVQRIQHQTLMHQDLGRGCSRPHRAGGELQGFGVLALVVSDQRKILQGVNVVRPRRKDRGVEPLGFGHPTLLV